MKPVTVTLISNASLETPRKLTPSDTKALGVPLQVRDDYLRSLPKMNITHLTTVEATPENTKKLKKYIMGHKYQIRDMILLLHNYLQIQVIGAISNETFQEHVKWVRKELEYIMGLICPLVDQNEVYEMEALQDFIHDLSFNRIDFIIGTYRRLNEQARQASIQ